MKRTQKRRAALRKRKEYRRRIRRLQQQEDERRGAVLVVVLALLGLLMLVGFITYTFSNQENASARYFADSAKVAADPTLTPDMLFDWGLEQIIIGPGDDVEQSVLGGGYHSLMANMFGRDKHPFSGQGINVINSGGLPAIDQDRDKLADLQQLFLQLNHSKSAHDGTDVYSATQFPDPDIDVTYPDQNMLPLAYNAYTLDSQNRPVKVLVPSFHRPQLLRTNQASGIKLQSDWDVNPSTKAKVFRPHAEHVDVNDVTTKRFIGPTEFSANPTYFTSRGVNSAFPFGQHDDGVWNMRLYNDTREYGLGEWVISPDENSYFYKCITSSNTGRPGPGGPAVWPTTPGDTVTDGDLVWECFEQPTYKYDADPDGDGQNEAIWLDLGFPPQRLPNGNYYVPLFAVTMYDLDGLVNLLAHGNENGVVNLHDGFEFGFDGGANQLSRSNAGLTPAEVNAGRILTADPVNDLAGDPDEIFATHKVMTGRAPTSRIEAANMELWQLLVGAKVFNKAGDLTDILRGRYGEVGLLENGYTSRDRWAFPKPGRSAGYQAGIPTDASLADGADDNNNINTGAGNFSTRPFVHPLDFSTVGSQYNGKLPNLKWYGPNRWLEYKDYPIRGSLGYAGYHGGVLMQQSATATQKQRTFALVDEPSEMELDPDFITLSPDVGDAPFDYEDVAYFMATNADIERLGLSSRPAKLAPFNFIHSKNAKEIRKRASTMSWDLKTHGRHFPGQFASNNARPWEFVQENVGGRNQYRFPTYIPGLPDNIQPIRGVLRQLLETYQGDQTTSPELLEQRMMSLLQVPYRDVDGKIKLRGLTEHPLMTSSRILHEIAFADMTAEEQQEHLARVDRQQMARDIYTLLYLYGGGRDDVDYTTSNASNNLYDDNQLREMAQFAINVVNALDRDDTIDLFEYDKDLSNGWNLDDNPYTNDITTDRSVVAGVELQTLTLSEVMAVRAKQHLKNGTPTDHGVTEYDDTKDRYFSFVELRNASPKAVSLKGGGWQVEINTADGTGNTITRRLTLLSDDFSYPANTQPIPGGDLFTILSAGDEENVDQSRPERPVLPSYIKLDLEYATNRPNGNYDDFVAPVAVGGRRVDLILADDTLHYRLEDGNGNPLPKGNFFNASNVGTLKDGSGGSATVILKRRSNLTRPNPVTTDPRYERENPFIEVDRFIINDRNSNGGYGEMEITRPDDDAAVISHIKQQLRQFRSTERVEPLSRKAPPTNGVTGFSRTLAEIWYSLPAPPVNGDYSGHPVAFNSIGSTNTATTNAGNRFTQWQPHFDRDFASAIELFAVPMYPPWDVTALLDWSGKYSAGNEKFLAPLVHGAYGADGKPGNANVDDDGDTLIDEADERGLGEDPNPSANPQYSPKYDNRWYRLLGLAGVPTRANGFDRYRVHGKINWNTLRYPEVLAALLDDPSAFSASIPLQPELKQQSYLPDASSEPGRDWWAQFLESRDAFDSSTRLLLPGLPGSRPFRGLTFTEEGVDSIQYTMLRELPLDKNRTIHASENKRRLLELGDATERYDNPLISSDGNTIDHYSRHRLLSKVMANSTHRSNAFFIFMQVKFFEAINEGTTTNPKVRIGGEMTDSPSFRGFFVVDRARAMALLRPEHMPDPDPNTKFSFNRSFDFRKLVMYRKVVQ